MPLRDSLMTVLNQPNIMNAINGESQYEDRGAVTAFRCDLVGALVDETDRAECRHEQRDRADNRPDTAVRYVVSGRVVHMLIRFLIRFG